MIRFLTLLPVALLAALLALETGCMWPSTEHKVNGLLDAYTPTKQERKEVAEATHYVRNIAIAVASIASGLALRYGISTATMAGDAKSIFRIGKSKKGKRDA